MNKGRFQQLFSTLTTDSYEEDTIEKTYLKSEALPPIAPNQENTSHNLGRASSEIFDLTKIKEEKTDQGTGEANIDASIDDTTMPVIKNKARIHAIERAPNADIRPIQKWEGTVTDREGDRFLARLRDLTLEDNDIKEEGEFSLYEVHPDDRHLVQLGGVFYYTISFKTDLRTGQPTTENTVFFRRQAPYTGHQINEMKTRADALNALIRSNSERHSTQH